MLDVKGQSAFVQYEQDGLPRRSYVDTADITEDVEVPVERLGDAPYGIDWAQHLDLDVETLKRDIERYLKEHGIWTLADLQAQDRVIIRLATDLLGGAIWKAAKRAGK